MASQFGLRVGNNIRNYRLAKGMSMRELAGKVGLTEATIQKYETGAIKTLDVSMLMKFAEALNIPPEDVVGWDKVEKRQLRHRPRKKQLRRKQRLLLKRLMQRIYLVCNFNLTGIWPKKLLKVA